MSEWELIGKIGVDAGMVQIGDPCYYNENSIKDMRNAWDNPENDPEFWNKFCEASVNGVNVLPYGNAAADANGIVAGLCVSSGYGDGCYNVYAKYSEGRVAAVMIEFIEEEEE